ncbi:MAG: ABC transporter permease [Clostridium sp.]|nr:ABC transporter permease [Clostridium sp.]MCM1398550.1 ABC transporter permease [Clostridium sp.]MCM1459838.1 ABC transporter permease [Bacteroides sp.]
MKNAYGKHIARTIKKSIGRYLAIMAIVALGVGFFSGLKVSKPAMVETGNSYIKEHNLYDFKLLSTYGFTADEVDTMKELFMEAEGAYSQDFIYVDSEGNESVIKACSITDHVNNLKLVAGRLPENKNECVLDAYSYGEDMIGKELSIDDSNSDEIKDMFESSTYTVVGTVSSPVYLNYERGTTSLGNGRLGGFVYLPKETFTSEYYTELYLKCQDTFDIYTDEYDDYIESITDYVESKLEETVDVRYKELLEDIDREYEEAVDEITAKVNEQYTLAFYANLLEAGYTENIIDELLRDGTLSLPQEEIDNQIDALVGEIELPEPAEPEIYVLDRNSNIGYVCFKNDSAIVEGMAKVFPVFFFLIAALVCSTTMTRMIDDERGQIGTLRALGYSNGSIILKYVIYSGSAAGIGGIAGFFGGTYVFPYVIWTAYDMMYGFADIKYYFSPVMLVISLIVAFLCSAGTTFIACKNELRCTPADLIRPKAPTAGKRILLERITPIWKHMKFLYKVTARNVFRFKKRMFMMILGIAGCMALVMTGLGLKDSISNIAAFQYDEIEVFDIDATFSEPVNDSIRAEVDEALGDDKKESTELYKTSLEYQSSDTSKTVYLTVAEGESLNGFVDFHKDGTQVEYPEYGKVMLSQMLADTAGVKAGDTFTLTDSDGKKVALEVSDTFENYVWHYAYITPEMYEDFFGKKYEPNSMYINFKDADVSYEAGAALTDIEGVMNVNVVMALKDRIANMMKMLNSIVWLIIGCAAALAFIVLINLSNINITERVREIATIKVLGFYAGETGAYVFRENVVLTLLGIIVGLPLGKWLHAFVISQIKIDLIAFKITIFPISYVLGILIVFLFLVIVDLIMRRKLEAIDMAESLKSIE